MFGIVITNTKQPRNVLVLCPMRAIVQAVAKIVPAFRTWLEEKHIEEGNGHSTEDSMDAIQERLLPVRQPVCEMLPGGSKLCIGLPDVGTHVGLSHQSAVPHVKDQYRGRPS